MHTEGACSGGRQVTKCKLLNVQLTDDDDQDDDDDDDDDDFGICYWHLLKRFYDKSYYSRLRWVLCSTGWPEIAMKKPFQKVSKGFALSNIYPFTDPSTLFYV